jgi:toxin ParE1/3/4
MSLRLDFRSAAQAEFDQAALWYESQRIGLGQAFVDAVQQVLEVIATHPLQHPLVDRDVRGALVPHFPYSVHYRIKPDRVVIVAVFHASRDPSLWQERK